MATSAGQLVTGALSSATRGSFFQPFEYRPFNIWLSGTFSANVAIIRSFDTGVTWVAVPIPSLASALVLTTATSITCYEPDASALWAVSTAVADGGAFTSGTVNYRIG